MTTTAEPPVVSRPEVQQVLARMRELGEQLPRRDGLAVFNQVYLTVTEQVTASLTAGRFGDATATAALDVLFARRYLDVACPVSGDAAPPAAWRPLLQARHRTGITPLQFALAGVNAHVGHDLALAVVDTCRALECEPEALEADFDRVGVILTALEEAVREALMPGPDLLDLADPLTHLVGSWSLERARDAAWAAARALWALRGLPDVTAHLTRRLDSGVGLVSRFLLTPLG
ncbi:DUF5995 family protein [Streptomyces sp. NPDC059740]|uniref:DUF5995 family protein n=1 Tax=Streptomyces sp. NPDC059740 TaxID=3346926 RepID=UPI0036492E58